MECCDCCWVEVLCNKCERIDWNAELVEAIKWLRWLTFLTLCPLSLEYLESDIKYRKVSNAVRWCSSGSYKIKQINIYYFKTLVVFSPFWKVLLTAALSCSWNFKNKALLFITLLVCPVEVALTLSVAPNCDPAGHKFDVTLLAAEESRWCVIFVRIEVSSNGNVEPKAVGQLDMYCVTWRKISPAKKIARC